MPFAPTAVFNSVNEARLRQAIVDNKTIDTKYQDTALSLLIIHRPAIFRNATHVDLKRRCPYGPPRPQSPSLDRGVATPIGYT